MEKVIVFGNGQMAEIVHTYLIHDSDYEVVAFTVDKEFIGSGEFRGLPVVAFEDVHEIYPPDAYAMFILLGAKDCNRLRESKYLDAKQRGYRFISYVSSKATICPENEIGENCFILENNVIQSFVKIEDNCVLWSGNHIGHHSVIHAHNYLASHVVVSGGVTINSYCYLGVNATIRDHIEIAKASVIGAGALVMRPTEENGVYMGLPCKKTSIRSNEVDLP